jgi:cation:H+ antiporter
MPNLDVFAYLSLLFVLCVALARAADLVQAAMVLLAQKLKINPFLIGFVVLSVASSLPEITVALTAAGSQDPSLSVGNLLGGMIILLTLVIGVNTIRHSNIKFVGRFGLKQLYGALLVNASNLLVLLDGNLTVLDGVFLITMYVTYVLYLSHASVGLNNRHDHLVTFSRKELSEALIKASIGIIGLVLLARLAVDTAIHTATMLNVPESIIGLIVLALGTNMPEIMIALRSHGRDEERLAIGNALGSATVNACILGVLAVVAPHQLPNLLNLLPSMLILFSTIILFGVTATTGQMLTKKEGSGLLALYTTLILVEAAIILF